MAVCLKKKENSPSPKYLRWSYALGSLENDLPSYLLSNNLGHHIPCVDVDGADGHDLLPVAWSELTNQHGDEGVELGHLLPVVLLHRAVIALLQAGKGHTHVRCPPDLSAGQCHLIKVKLNALQRRYSG